ncbi:MAG: 4-(cytidine 5'-diphospho)-2-C-methyl-D-erythritol kinase [Gammaproteobacteria bacterium]|nr:4-(cytidine 5'-diphospho)-2-C-methyl-D-erythritol kinase [Gammaproteobacteria bacterium]
MKTERAEAPAKLNLTLRVLGLDTGGYHLLRSLAQTVSWFDTVEVGVSSDDELEIAGLEVPSGGENLVWQAIEALRALTGIRTALRIRLQKRIAVAAGLGGGSADAAAALLLAAAVLDIPFDLVSRVAPSIGADVPFCLLGGLAMMEGRGERLTALTPAGDYAVAIVTPPFVLETAAVYRAWDRLGDPKPRGITGKAVPPSLRQFAPLINDLEPAALSIARDLEDWMIDLEDRWDRPVLLTGSGPSLFAFFSDEQEAASALATAPPGARAGVSAVPLATGARCIE